MKGGYKFSISGRSGEPTGGGPHFHFRLRMKSKVREAIRDLLGRTAAAAIEEISITITASFSLSVIVFALTPRARELDDHDGERVKVPTAVFFPAEQPHRW